MPGVPTYRGCDACRKQKKKCDMATPACSRCARLKIACVGCGQLRYKFKDQTDLQAVRSSKKARSRASLQFETESDSPGSIVSIASSRDSARSGAFVFLLDITDPSYDLGCYGPWFKDLPRRMGTNEALDAAVEAMVGFYPHLRRHEQTSLSRGSLVKYVNALQALRTCLNDPQKASRPETLCAVYILLICQGWTGRDNDQKVSHGEGLAYLLDAMESRQESGQSSDQFQDTIRLTLYVPVILEAIFNPRIRLSSWFSRLKERAFGPPAPITHSARKFTSLQMQSLARIPDLLREPAKHIDDILTSYQRIRIEIPLLKGSLELADALVSGSPTNKSTKTRIHYQALVGLLLASALIFNAYLRAFGADDGNMVEEADNMANDAIKLAHDASQYRPLGASFAPLCLIPAWTATDNIEIQQRVIEALRIYQDDFSAATSRGWYIMAYWLRGELDRIRSGLGPSPMEDYGKRQWGTLTLDGQGNMVCDGDVSDWFYCSE